MPAVTVKPAFLSHASYIASNMREADKAEILCQLPDGFKTWQIASTMLSAGDSFIAYLGDEPVMFFGCHPLNVCTMEAWAMGTSKTNRVLLEVTRFLFSDYIPRVVEAGFLSVECRTHAEHKSAHRWLERTGAVAASSPFVYGKNGELFILYRWTRDCIADVQRRYKVLPDGRTTEDP